jgi:3-hydroxyacyl-CoA dehydrogenase
MGSFSVSPLVRFSRDGNIGVILVDNPPVNALKNEVRAGLVESLAQARADASIEAVVLACAGRTFIAGADISEFGKPTQSPTTIDVIAAIEAMPKPVIAAMHGTPLGGGLEVALGCHYRIAVPGTKLGLPEIKLGLMPGAGGTQRLPRLVGVEKALAMILTGDQVPAKEALEAGLVDEIVDGSLENSVAFARRVAADRRPLVLARNNDAKLVQFKGDGAKFEAIAAKYLKRGALHAPAAAVAAVRWSLDLPIEEALKREREKFVELVADDQSKAQRHIFFAERDAAKIKDLPADVKVSEVKRAAVIGAGTMGGGIAMCFANAGIPVTIVEASQDALTRGLDAIKKNYLATVARGGLSEAEKDRRIALMTSSVDMAAVADADLIIEAVFEDMEVKARLFGDLDRLAKPGAVLATNTSYLDVDAIARTTSRPASVVGMHFFSPANVMRLLEIVRGAATAPATLATAVAVGRKIGKAPAVVGVCHGFVGNRMLRLRSVEAERLLLEGALPQDIDAAMTAFGFPMGPLAASDLAGLDISWRMRKAQGLSAAIADQLCERGYFGQKSGRGFYRYEAGSRAPKPDAEVEQLIIATSQRLNVKRRPIDKSEIVERLLFPMINEGARILDEGIAARPGDIDVIWVYGYGFPIWRGGPMHYADSVGLAHVRDRLREFAAQTGDTRHEPAPLLVRLADQGRGFASLSDAKA